MDYVTAMTDHKQLKLASAEIADIIEFYGIEVKFTDYGITLELGDAELELGPDDDTLRTLRGEE